LPPAILWKNRQKEDRPCQLPRHPPSQRLPSSSIPIPFASIAALWTFVDGHRVAFVPQSAKLDVGVLSKLKGQEDAPEKNVSVIYSEENAKPAMELTELHMTVSPLPGVIFTVVLGLVLFVTNISLRGLMSYLVVGFVALLLLILNSFGLLRNLGTFAALLDIRINMGGFLFIATLLLAIWLLSFYFFDRQVYIIFTTGQVKVCAEVGDGEKVYDVTGLHFEKLRSDKFRHGLLGFGSGDLVVYTSGADRREFRFDNVLNIDKKIKDIEALIGAKRQVTINHV
jgi:hypothetical protein